MWKSAGFSKRHCYVFFSRSSSSASNLIRERSFRLSNKYILLTHIIYTWKADFVHKSQSTSKSRTDKNYWEIFSFSINMDDATKNVTVMSHLVSKKLDEIYWDADGYNLIMYNFLRTLQDNLMIQNIWYFELCNLKELSAVWLKWVRLYYYTGSFSNVRDNLIMDWDPAYGIMINYLI